MSLGGKEKSRNGWEQREKWGRGGWEAAAGGGTGWREQGHGERGGGGSVAGREAGKRTASCPGNRTPRSASQSACLGPGSQFPQPGSNGHNIFEYIHHKCILAGVCIYLATFLSLEIDATEARRSETCHRRLHTMYLDRESAKVTATDMYLFLFAPPDRVDWQPRYSKLLQASPAAAPAAPSPTPIPFPSLFLVLSFTDGGDLCTLSPQESRATKGPWGKATAERAHGQRSPNCTPARPTAQRVGGFVPLFSCPAGLCENRTPTAHPCPTNCLGFPAIHGLLCFRRCHINLIITIIETTGFWLPTSKPSLNATAGRPHSPSTCYQAARGGR